MRTLVCDETTTRATGVARQKAERKGGRLLVVDAATGTAEEKGGLRWGGLPKNPIYGSESEGFKSFHITTC